MDFSYENAINWRVVLLCFLYFLVAHAKKYPKRTPGHDKL